MSSQSLSCLIQKWTLLPSWNIGPPDFLSIPLQNLFDFIDAEISASRTCVGLDWKWHNCRWGHTSIFFPKLFWPESAPSLRFFTSVFYTSFYDRERRKNLQYQYWDLMSTFAWERTARVSVDFFHNKIFLILNAKHLFIKQDINFFKANKLFSNLIRRLLGERKNHASTSCPLLLKPMQVVETNSSFGKIS